jgi:IMP dehydrogenase
MLHENRIEKLPLVSDSGELAGMMTTQDIVKIEYWKNSARDKKGRLLVGAAVGVRDTIERARALVNAGVDVILLDVAHAHSDLFIERLKELKRNVSVDVVAGTVVTEEAAIALIEAGADGLQVGIGVSPICTTRIISGAGMPQLTAIMNVSKAANQFDVPICIIGGVKYPGDVAKALAAGTDTVMSGYLFAGTDEAPGRVIMKDGRKYKKYIGSASYESAHARKEIEDGKKIKEKLDLFVEGVSNLVDYKGPVEEVIKSILKGVKSGFSYCGARNMEELHEKAEFIEITSAGHEESLARGKRLSE